MWRKIWSDPVWSTVIASAIIAFAGAASVYFFNLWPAILGFAQRATAYALATSSVPNWAIGLIALVAAPTVLVILVALWQMIFTPPPPLWQSYTQDEFKGLVWRWQYDRSGHTTNLRAFCPKCDYQMPATQSHHYGVGNIHVGFLCEACKGTIKEFPCSYRALEDTIRRFIDQKVRNGTWPKA